MPENPHGGADTEKREPQKVVALSVNVLLPVFRNRELLMEWQVGNVMLGAAMGEKPFIVGAYVSEIRQDL